jgi:3-hydroxymyristoyl/3-hydroxydecanoyl-(acyl carrier protein) dehydratase
LSVFKFIDKIGEYKKGESLTGFYTLTGKEEFLKDHFENFPVMPGVLLLEMVKQAASKLLELSYEADEVNYRLADAEEVKFGQFVKSGSELKVSVRLIKREGQRNLFDGRIDLMNVPFGKALSATLALVPICRVS